MSEFQKIVKYLAMAFAIFLCVNIFGGILMALSGLSIFFSGNSTDAIGEMQVYDIEGEVSSLSIELSGAKLKIVTGDAFSVESNHKYIAVNSDNGKIRISETKEFFGFSTEGVTVILNVPKDFVFDDVNIEAGAGKVEIDTLSADVLELSFGAGEADIKNLTANSRAKIDGGAGELTIDGGKLCNLKLDMGVGELTLKSRIEGESRLNYGVGEANLTLLGSHEDYKIEIDKGIGEAKLSGESMKDDSIYGSGENSIEIDGGIGAINIEFLEN